MSAQGVDSPTFGHLVPTRGLNRCRDDGPTPDGFDVRRARGAAVFVMCGVRMPRFPTCRRFG